jgi:transposase InsO family protein
VRTRASTTVTPGTQTVFGSAVRDILTGYGSPTSPTCLSAGDGGISLSSSISASRRVVGWSLAAHRGTDLTRAAFHHALRLRRPKKGLIFHSDRGSEYGGRRFIRRLRSLGLRQSMGRPGTPADNAHAESFFHSLKADVIHGVQFSDERQRRRCLTTYIAYYNRHRLHSSLGHRSPVEYESEIA